MADPRRNFRALQSLNEKIKALETKVKRQQQINQNIGSDLFGGAVTLNEQLNERNVPLLLSSPEASANAVPVIPQLSGAGVLNPLGPEQTGRVYNAQQMRDLQNATRRFSEDVPTIFSNKEVVKFYFANEGNFTPSDYVKAIPTNEDFEAVDMAFEVAPPEFYPADTMEDVVADRLCPRQFSITLDLGLRKSDY